VVQSVVGKLLRLVMTQWVRHLATSLLKSSKLSSLGLMHIHRDFEVDLYKAMEVFISAKTRREEFGQFYQILVYQSH
jgi:hypothetical protein